MTKSEAKAIAESTGRALRHMNMEIINKLELPKEIPAPLRSDVRAIIWDSLKLVADEIERVREMALAELGK